MIAIMKNPNFKEWYNISLFGDLKDNARTLESAIRKATKLQAKEQLKGRKLMIKQYDS